MRKLTTPRLLALLLTFAVTANARGAGPADSLFRLTPPDAGVTLAIEDLRGHIREFLASPLAGRLAGLPLVRTWLASPRFASFQAARRQIERGLNATLEEIRDNLFGDAVVLTLRIPPQGRQDEARGMLLVRVRDRALLDRLVDAINHDQKRKGELERIEERTHHGVTYRVREFTPQARRPTECYLTLVDQTFAWSNSEELILGVIERSQNAQKGLSDQPAFQRVRERLPERAVLSLFIDPRFLATQLAEASKPSTAGDAHLADLVQRYLEALVYLGGAVELRGATSDSGVGLVLHVEEAIGTENIPAWLKRWAAMPVSQPGFDRVPASAIALVSAHMDFPALEELVRVMTPGTAQNWVDNLLLSVQGLMLGRDLRTAILPSLGPSVLAFLDTEPVSRGVSKLSFAISIDLKAGPGEDGVAAAIDNGLRTILAIYALDPKHRRGPLEVQTQNVRGVRVTALTPSSPFAYAIGDGRLVLGGSADSVVQALAPAGAPSSRLVSLRAVGVSEAESFLRIDLEKLRAFAESHRSAIARRIASRKGAAVEAATQDLDHVLSLLSPFQDAFLTGSITPDARSVHRRFGLVAPAEPAETVP